MKQIQKCSEILQLKSVCDSILSKIYPSARTKPIVLAIAGYPALGKSTLSNTVASSCHPLNCFIIQSESWIKPWEVRMQLDVSGSHPNAYELSDAVADITAFLNGTSISFRNYSHQTGNLIDSVDPSTLGATSLVILDGTPFSLPKFRPLIDHVYFITPKCNNDWLEFAIHRDKIERNFSYNDAKRHNLRKLPDMLDVYKSSITSIDHLITADIIQTKTEQYSLTYCITESKQISD